MKENKPKQIVLILAIFLLTLFVTIYGLNTILEKPEYNDFCGDRSAKPVETQESCEVDGGKWINLNEPTFRGYCEITYECKNDYENARENYAKKIFLIAMPLSILIIILGAFFIPVNSVGTGLMLGGVGTILFGTGSYWGHASNPLKFFLSLLGLLILIWLGYRIEKRSKKK